jgi:hypothetical protein
MVAGYQTRRNAERQFRWGRAEAGVMGAVFIGRILRRNPSGALEAKEAVEALGNGRTVAETASRHGVDPNPV